MEEIRQVMLQKADLETLRAPNLTMRQRSWLLVAQHYLADFWNGTGIQDFIKINFDKYQTFTHSPSGGVS